MSPLLNAALKGAIEGITEFLPISSTGHLILIRESLPLTEDVTRQDTLNNLFDIIVQFPAIIAVIILFRQRLLYSMGTVHNSPDSRRFWIGIMIAFFPLALTGAVFKEYIKTYLFHPTPVAVALIVGGIILLFIERGPDRGSVPVAEEASLRQSGFIGIFQCLALLPGTSRSAATIIGGRLAGLSRAAAAEFSFFLAIPTLGGAFVYQLAKEHKNLQSSDVPVLIVGSAVSFITAWIFVGWLIKFLKKNSMAIFGWYRIVLGTAVLAWQYWQNS